MSKYWVSFSCQRTLQRFVTKPFISVGVIVFLRRRRTKKYIVSGWSITNFVRIISNDYIDLVTHPLLSFRRRTWLLTNSIASKCLVAKLYHCFPWGILHRVSHSGNQTFSHRYEWSWWYYSWMGYCSCAIDE